MKKQTKIILSVIIGIISCYIIINLCFGLYKNSQATAICYIKSEEKGGQSRRYIVYSGEEYYDWYDVKDKYKSEGDGLPSPDSTGKYKCEEVNYDEIIYVKVENSKLSASPMYKLYNDINADILFEENNSPGGPSLGWYFFRKDFVFPTIYNAKVSGIKLEYSDGNEGRTFSDEETIQVVVENIKENKDLTLCLPQDKYGDWRSIHLQYFDCPVVENVAGVYGQKFLYNDEYWEWTKTQEYRDWMNTIP